MDYQEIERISERVKEANTFVSEIREELGRVIIGQDGLILRVIITFLSRGHILLEGLPGLAKTLTVRAFARVMDTSFQRIQFTPDLLPADLIGTRIYNPKDLDFFTRKGPVFTNILLADEINRAPAKVQSALLQSMEERQVTIGDDTFNLPEPFMVLATENPIEQEGTYPLPEAQLDRFFMKVLVEYPTPGEEKRILTGFENIEVERLNRIIDPAAVLEKAALVDEIYLDDKLVDYIVDLVGQTRRPADENLARYIEFGASPRASINLMKAARCLAFIRGRGFVTPDDIKEIGTDILRHRIILSYEAEADGHSADDVIGMLFDTVEVP
jgi:MoxR-like ATPase